MAANNESPFRKKMFSIFRPQQKIALYYKDLQFDYMIKLEKDAEFLWHMAIGPRFMVISQSSKNF